MQPLRALSADLHRPAPEENDILVQATRSQLEHFRDVDARCKALQLPDGLMLRYLVSESLYFYLRTEILDGNIHTRVFASDSPYQPQKNNIGAVSTPLTSDDADANHLQKIQSLLTAWIEFIGNVGDASQEFAAFPLGNQAQR